MTDNVFTLPKRTLIRFDGNWPSSMESVDDLCKKRIVSGKDQMCLDDDSAIAMIGTALVLFNAGILRFNVRRSDVGFLISASKIDPDTITPKSTKYTYESQDVSSIFNGWPAGYSANINCQGIGHLGNIEGIEFPWVTVDWKERDRALMEKFDL